MDLFSNPWIVGIGGGVLSGLIVTVISRFVFSRRDDREYAQKVASVNREMTYALRPGISEGHIPNEEVLSSLINATARKYRVNRSDVFRPKQIAEELIKEILDSSFISSLTKQDYCETLAHLVTDKPAINEAQEQVTEKKLAESEYRARLMSAMSSILGLTAAMATMAMVFTRMLDGKGSSSLGSIFDVILPTGIVLMATMVAMLAMIGSKRLREIKHKTVLHEVGRKAQGTSGNG